MIPRGVNMRVIGKSIPRESGDDPAKLAELETKVEYSPRERG